VLFGDGCVVLFWSSVFRCFLKGLFENAFVSCVLFGVVVVFGWLCFLVGGVCLLLLWVVFVCYFYRRTRLTLTELSAGGLI
jgi:ABC-type multidrug transport system permease subunit